MRDFEIVRIEFGMGTLSRRGLSAVLQALLVLQLSALAIETVRPLHATLRPGRPPCTLSPPRVYKRGKLIPIPTQVESTGSRTQGFGTSVSRQRSGLCFHAPVMPSPVTRRSYDRGKTRVWPVRRRGLSPRSPAAAAVLAMQGGGSSGGGGLFHVAPMQCYTNRHLRFLLRQLSSKAVLWTEMEKVETFMRSEEATRRTLRFDPSERPVVLQLGGDDAELLAAASRRGRL